MGRFTAGKNAIAATWETPSAATVRQVESARADLTRAMAEVGPIVARARAMSTRLQAQGITFKVPPQ
jgi:hypothetical protein